MKATEIINWRKVSTTLSGNTESVRSNYSGDKYSEAYQDLIDFSEKWIKKHEKKKDISQTDAP